MMDYTNTPEDRKERRREFRRQALQKSKFAIPSGVTLLSIFCGFSSVVMSLNASTGDPSFYLKWSAIFLILAGIFDGMDGRLARMTNTTTEFGIQLDSIADITSFGMAPAIMAYQYAFIELGRLDPQLKFIGWAACFFYLACGALRLARFNIQTKETDPRFFMGMPIPMAAGTLASVVLHWPVRLTSKYLALFFALQLFLAGIFMVSNVRFASFKKSPFGVSRPFNKMVLFILLTALLIGFQSTFLLWFGIVLVVGNLMINGLWLLGWTGITPPIDEEEAEPDASGV